MTNVEKQIADGIAKANGLTVASLGLRFDKVVVRLLGSLRIFVEQTVPDGEVVIVTVTAPIKVPAKTVCELEGRIKDFQKSGIRHRDQRLSIFQNEVSIRIVTASSKRVVKFVGLVHNPNIDSKQLLDLAAQWLSDGQGINSDDF